MIESVSAGPGSNWVLKKKKYTSNYSTLHGANIADKKEAKLPALVGDISRNGHFRWRGNSF